MLTLSTVNSPLSHAASSASLIKSGLFKRCGFRTQSSAITCLPRAWIISPGNPPCGSYVNGRIQRPTAIESRTQNSSKLTDFLQIKSPTLRIRKDRALNIYSRRRPTLPQSRPCSTIGAGGLNFRVRNGNGCGPSAAATGKLFRIPSAFALRGDGETAPSCQRAATAGATLNLGLLQMRCVANTELNSLELRPG